MLMNYTCLDQFNLFGVFSVDSSSSDRILFRNLSELGVSFCGTLILNQSGSPTEKVRISFGYTGAQLSIVIFK